MQMFVEKQEVIRRFTLSLRTYYIRKLVKSNLDLNVTLAQSVMPLTFKFV